LRALCTFNSAPGSRPSPAPNPSVKSGGVYQRSAASILNFSQGSCPYCDERARRRVRGLFEVAELLQSVANDLFLFGGHPLLPGRRLPVLRFALDPPPEVSRQLGPPVGQVVELARVGLEVVQLLRHFRIFGGVDQLVLAGAIADQAPNGIV